MSQAQAASGRDRLPWLANEATPRSKYSLLALSGWLAAAALLVGGGTFWLVDRSSQSEPASQVAPARTTTVVLPGAQKIARQTSERGHKVTQKLALNSHRPSAPNRLAAAPRSRPVAKSAVEPVQRVAPARHMAVIAAAEPRVAAVPKAKGCRCAKHAVTIASEAPPKVAPAAVAPTHMRVAEQSLRSPAPWPQPSAPGSLIEGRVVQLGAFADMQQAKLVWRDMVRAYPAVGQFQPSLIENRDWNGRLFYQFQLGTASQADSETLCQSMKRLNFRCAVVGPRWKSQE